MEEAKIEMRHNTNYSSIINESRPINKKMSSKIDSKQLTKSRLNKQISDMFDSNTKESMSEVSYKLSHRSSQPKFSTMHPKNAHSINFKPKLISLSDSPKLSIHKLPNSKRWSLANNLMNVTKRSEMGIPSNSVRINKSPTSICKSWYLDRVKTKTHLDGREFNKNVLGTISWFYIVGGLVNGSVSNWQREKGFTVDELQKVAATSAEQARVLNFKIDDAAKTLVNTWSKLAL